MKTFEVQIKGVSPLLVNRFKEQAEVQETMKKRDKKDYGTPREQAEASAYMDEKTRKIWIPSTWPKGALTTVASDYKLRGSKKSVKSVIGGAVLPVEEKIYFKGDLTIKDIEVDSRPCVVQRARIMRHRARLEEWEIKFAIQIEDSILGPDEVKRMFDDAGRRAGVGDFRPARGGPFGRFTVTSWKELAK